MMNAFPKILGLIPARANSLGVPGKHLKLLGAHPLIHYTIQSARRSTLLNTIAVTTNCAEIARVMSGYENIEVPFLRPEHLALAQTPTLPVVQHALAFYENAGKEFDYVCLLQPTTPFRSDGMIDEAIMLLVNARAESLATVRKTPLKYSPFWNFQIRQDHTLSKVTNEPSLFTRRQDLPETYYRDGQIYITSAGLIRKNLLINEETIAFVNESGPDINIDTMDDWHAAANWIGNGN